MLKTLLPHHAEYEALKAELARVEEEQPGTKSESHLRDLRLRKLRATLERWRWLPHAMPERRVEVHVPAFHVVLMNGDTVQQTHRAIVGKTSTRTASFAASIESVVLNPYWSPPDDIVRRELVPKLQNDPDYATREAFDILDSDGQLVDPTDADWNTSASSYHIRQRPGSKNALGRVKLDMPNPYAIYLHDTPEQSLFARLRRAFSHGCIRVENALLLARSLLDPPNSNGDFIDSALSSGRETTLRLSSPVPVFVLYLTAGRGEDGNIVYSDDIYGRDEALIAALDANATGQVLAQRTEAKANAGN
jgi:murein L,D-transpeptidase YcbB/YkuD